MEFGEHFRQVRSARRMKMRDFGVAGSYINAIENRGLLPGPEKMEQILTALGQVASEQGMAEPEIESEELRISWRTSLFIRMGLDPNFAELVAEASALGPDQQAIVMKAVKAVRNISA